MRDPTTYRAARRNAARVPSNARPTNGFIHTWSAQWYYENHNPTIHPDPNSRAMKLGRKRAMGQIRKLQKLSQEQNRKMANIRKRQVA